MKQAEPQQEDLELFKLSFDFSQYRTKAANEGGDYQIKALLNQPTEKFKNFSKDYSSQPIIKQGVKFFETL